MSRHHITSPKPLTLIVLGLLSVGLLGLRMLEFKLSGAGLHVDEAQYWLWSNDLQWGYFSKPPVLVALIKLSTSWFGSSLLGLKTLAMLCWILSAWVLGWLAYRISGMKPAIIAGGLFSSTLISGLLGLSVTTDAPLTLFWALCMLSLWEAAHAKGKTAVLWWITGGLCLGLAVLSKYSALALGASAIWLLVTCPASQRRKVFSGGLIATVVALVVLLPHLAWNLENHWPTAQHTLDITVRETGSTVAQGAGGWRRVLSSGLEFSLGQLLILGPSIWLVCAWLWRHSRNPTSHPTTPEATHATRIWSVSTYALAFSSPILVLGLAQALNSKALINWSVPMGLGVCLWLAWKAHQLSIRTSRVVWICLTGIAVSGVIAVGGDLKQFVGVQTSANQSRWDIWGRMRGWNESLQTLAPALSPYRDLPWVTSDRSILVQTAYSLRELHPALYSWNSDGAVHHHFDWKQPWNPNSDAKAFVWIYPSAPPAALVERFPNVRKLGDARSGRISLEAWLLENSTSQP